MLLGIACRGDAVGCPVLGGVLLMSTRKTAAGTPTQLDAKKMAAEILKELKAEKATVEFVRRLRTELRKQAETARI